MHNKEVVKFGLNQRPFIFTRGNDDAKYIFPFAFAAFSPRPLKS